MNGNAMTCMHTLTDVDMDGCMDVWIARLLLYQVRDSCRRKRDERKRQCCLTKIMESRVFLVWNSVGRKEPMEPILF